MAEPTTSTAAVGALLWKLLPGAIGSLIALGFIGEGLTRKQKVVSFLSGAAVAYYVGPLVIWIAHITDDSQKLGTGFLVGLFGLAITKELFKEINTADLIGAIKRRFFGGGQ
ncbi:TPA: holin [Burkholderia multivorans]|nr:holin [Burkholderia multivorans]HDR9291907.1 holin [Burkholderia multivorans]HDR9297801.1 holin [Burkholderia multivorans]HDR9303273.1 holin [Burkholderia multivorans]HDR9309389.1 holin [Burkholderia multivorans]